MEAHALTDQEFSQFRSFIYKNAGISLSPNKKPLVSGRLAKRLRDRSLSSYGEYLKLLSSGHHPDEVQTAVDLLTTNETYFFREPKHFDFLHNHVPEMHRPGRPFRVWSAASSSGQEAYSIAMVLADILGEQPWEVMASDISQRVLEKAQTGHYPLEQAKNIPERYLSKYCLKGVGSQDGTFLTERTLRSRISFMQVNLNVPLPRPRLGDFDIVFLRNVMIYFDMETKQQVVRRILETIRPGGYLLVGHSESLNGVVDEIKAIRPSIYHKK